MCLSDSSCDVMAERCLMEEGLEFLRLSLIMFQSRIPNHVIFQEFTYQEQSEYRQCKSSKNCAFLLLVPKNFIFGYIFTAIKSFIILAVLRRSA